jgi:hypothetical protein
MKGAPPGCSVTNLQYAGCIYKCFYNFYMAYIRQFQPVTD